ncbi:AraC-like DNA-binding protein [Rhizobium mesoamericanum]|uniref:AraC family transcriptional regulator n=1 Tax=Rhizobium mesoamericanum TaxID=1079800 RepID=UPI002788DCD4|nr:AraC family transcriptional regulator [Rhizobium mesoamericanum]MDQ0564321.1 AraC-like DNA-binding protein [Rhizobium mesoamericanum]
MAKDFGRSIGRFVGLEEPRTLSTRFLQLAEVTGGRLRWNEPENEAPVRMERSNGYLICLQRRYLAEYPYWVDGKPTPAMPLNAGQFLFLDLNDEHASLTRGAVDCVSMYTSNEALQRFHEEHDLGSVGALRTARGVAFDDRVIRNLGECLVPAFERQDTASQLFADCIALALMTHLSTRYAERPAVVRPIRGGLAPWQERRSKEMLLANLNGKISLGELASACGLSRSHFAREFKATMGMPPLQWLMTQRIERAKHLLLDPFVPIDLIAEQCGFSDQSHFTRSFSKAVGVTPASWRRVRCQ